MNKRIKLLPICIVLLMLGSLFTFSAYATAEGGDTPVVSTPVTPDPGPGDTPVTPDPGPVDPGPGDTPVTSDPGTSSTPEYTPDPDPGTDTPVTSNPVTSTPNAGGYVDSYTNEDGYYYYDEDTMVNSIDDYAGDVSDYTSLYDTSDFNESALKESKWADITIDTSKAPSNADAMDFSAIKDNKSTKDDGQLILYTGYVLIGLSLIGIIYYIIATATYKRKLKALTTRESYYHSGEPVTRPRNDYGDSDEFPTARDYNRRYNTRRYTSDNRSYAERKRSKADTAEIHLE